MLDVPPAIAAEIKAITGSPEGEQLRALCQRARERGAASPEQLLTAQLAGIAMNPVARARFDQRLGTSFQSVSNLNMVPAENTIVDEVIAGAGFHGAVYAAVRHLQGFDKPYVLDTASAGGAFAVSKNPSFYLNSENTGGLPGAPWTGAANQLNWLPGAPVQAAHISGRELTDNTVMRFVIRATLMMHARLITRTTVRFLVLVPQAYGIRVTVPGNRYIRCKRLIIATGLGPEAGLASCNGSTILSWSQLMGKMDLAFPFDGVRRVAVIGGGKSALCAAEAALGIGPDASMRAAADGMPRVDIYALNLPQSRQDWMAQTQSRYLRLGSHLPTRIETGEDQDPVEPDGFGRFADLRVLGEKGVPVAVPGGVTVNGRFYDLAVMCTGHVVSDFASGLTFAPFKAAGRQVAVKAQNLEVYRVGPCADLPWEAADYTNRIAANREQRVAMHRLAPLTAALAAVLPRL